VFVELYQKTHELLNHERKLLAANRKLEQEVQERRLKEEKIRLLNEQLLENNLQLKTTVEELDRFAYVASHDLQEPLRKILVFSDKLQTKYKDKLDTEVGQSLEKIAKASTRMQSLINDLLKFSRQTTADEDFVAIPLNQLLQDVIADLEIEIEKSSAQIHLDGLPEIWGIPSQIRQLFQNLLSNAIKFRKKSENPAIRIFTEPWNGLNRVIIQDNGIGFDPKYAEEIFMVFKRLHSYHEFEGSGVGLSICKKIIDRHSGFIKAESKIGEGSKFIIEFPVIKARTEIPELKVEKVNIA
jgi:light-regulated signal transduction histidine kinase (bacteriophytochrome)